MTYETGSASGPVNLLSKFLDFAVNTMGWTEDYAETEGQLATDDLQSVTGRGGVSPNSLVRISKTGNSELHFSLRAINYAEDSDGNRVSNGAVASDTDPSFSGIYITGSDSFRNDPGWQNNCESHSSRSDSIKRVNNDLIYIGGNVTAWYHVGSEAELTSRNDSNENGFYTIQSATYDSTNNETAIDLGTNLDDTDDQGTLRNHLYGENDEIHIPGDRTGMRSKADQVYLAGSNTGDNGWYEIASLSYNSNDDQTEISVSGNISTPETGLTVQYAAWFNEPGRSEMRNRDSVSWFDNESTTLGSFNPPPANHVHSAGLADIAIGNIGKYWFFGRTNPEQLWCWYEYDSGKWLWFGCGEIEPVNSSINQTAFYCGSQCNTNSRGYDEGNIVGSHNVIPFAGSKNSFGSGGSAANNGSAVRINNSNYNGWSVNQGEEEDTGAGVPGSDVGEAEMFGSDVMGREMMESSPNNFNNLHVLAPFNVYAGEGDKELFAHLGSVPDMRYLNMDELRPEDEITLGSTTWVILPAWKKYDPSQTGLNYNYGVAFKKQ